MNTIYITTSGKTDGVGSQVLSKILAMLYCKEKNYNYIHNPIKTLDFREQDETGRKAYESGKGEQWVQEWNRFLNLGRNLETLNDIKYDICLDITDVLKTGQITMKDNYLWHDFDPTPIIEKCNNKLIKQKILFIVKEFPKIDRYSNNLQKIVTDNLIINYNITTKPILKYDKNKLNIVIHKRHTRGNKLKIDTNLNAKNNRVTLNSYYLDIIKKCYEKYNKNDNLQFWIFSDGSKKDFPELEYVFENQAIIKNSVEPIKINMMLKTDSMETFHYFVKADILILDKSSFGYLAGMYNTNTVIYNPYWDKKHYKWKLIEELI